VLAAIVMRSSVCLQCLHVVRLGDQQAKLHVRRGDAIFVLIYIYIYIYIYTYEPEKLYIYIYVYIYTRKLEVK
jgi:hypothetical protein